MLQEMIQRLVQYGIDTGLTPECERIYTTNLLLDLFCEDEYHPSTGLSPLPLEEILDFLLGVAVQRQLIEDTPTYRDLFDTRKWTAPMVPSTSPSTSPNQKKIPRP